MKRWPLNKAYFWETAPFFRILLPFAIGIFCYDRNQSLSLNGSNIIVAICVLFLLYTSLVYTTKTYLRTPIVTFSLLTALLFLSGITIAYYGDVRNDKQWFGHNAGDDKSYLAVITEAPAEKEHSWKVPVTLVSSIHNSNVANVTGNAIIYLYKDRLPMMFHKGDSIIVPGKWQAIKNAGNPFEFDYVTYARRNNLFHTQICSVNDIRLFATGNYEKAPVTDRAQSWCMRQLDKYIADPKAKGLIQAMILGNEKNLDPDLLRSYADTGIIHIIAISGGNIAIFFIVISFLLWWLRHRKHLWIKYMVALPLVWFYVLMAGSAPSAIRAATMFSLLAFSILFEKNSNSVNQLFATAFLLLFAEPMWLFSVGFQLSFVAVLSLILFYTPVFKWVSPTNKIARLLWGTVAASIAAEILVAPLVIYYFHMFPLLFVAANAAAYVFMSFVLILGIAVIVLGFFPALAAAIGAVVTVIVTVFDRIVTWMQQLNPESFHFLMLTGMELVLCYFTIAGISVFLLKQQKSYLYTGLIATCVLMFAFCTDEWSYISRQYFIVYNSSNTNQIELIRHNTYVPVTADTQLTRQNINNNYLTHTNRQAWKKDSTSVKDIFMVNGKKVLVLNEAISSNAQFPVDILVINYSGNIDVQQLRRVFIPSLVVIGNNYTEKQQSRWVKAFASNGVAVHAVAIKGAFCLN